MVGSTSSRLPDWGRRFVSRFQPPGSMMQDPIVYIVDDDPDMLDSLRWLMKTVGLRVEAFSSAAEFLRDFSPSSPGCLIFDVRMPGTSGLDLFETWSPAASGCR